MGFTFHSVTGSINAVRRECLSVSETKKNIEIISQLVARAVVCINVRRKWPNNGLKLIIHKFGYSTQRKMMYLDFIVECYLLLLCL